jgi:hypothetical protein
LGGLGRLVAAWLAGTGEVRHIALLSRSGRVPDGARRDLAALLRADVAVSAHALDAGCAEGCAALLAAAGPLLGGGAPLQALFHASGLLEDGLLGGQSLAGLRRVLAPKLGGQARMQAGLATLPVEQVGGGGGGGAWLAGWRRRWWAGLLSAGWLAAAVHDGHAPAGRWPRCCRWCCSARWRRCWAPLGRPTTWRPTPRWTAGPRARSAPARPAPASSGVPGRRPAWPRSR